MPRPPRIRQSNPATATGVRRGPVTGLIFVSGAVLMALEIAGSRVLAPFFGSSVFVWGSLIGIFLGAMSGGYWLGGWLSERWPRQVLLNGLLAAAGAFTLLLPLWASPLCRALAGGPEGWVDLGPRLGPLTAALILFALPSLLMGVASPFAVRLLAPDLQRVGAVAGRLYAVGTLGSIVGTLLTAFWLIPAFGVNTILTGIGAVLVATAAFTLPIGRAALVILGIGAGLLALRLLIAPPVLLAQPAKGRLEIVESRDSAYSAMTVVDHRLPGPGGQMAPVARQLRFGKYIQGAIFVHPWQQRGLEHWSAVPYTDLFHLARLFTPDMKRVLFIGGGVGVGPRSFRRHYPEAWIDLVEIDPVVLELAGTHFFFAPDERMAVHIADGRAFLRRNPDLRWDAIVLDAFGSGGRLPFHLMTREFLQTVRSHLTPDGVLLANLPAALRGPGGRVFRAEYRTFQAVFPSVYVFPRHDRAEQDAGSPAWWQRTRNVFLAATLGEPRTREDLVAEAERLWGALGRPPHRREDTELFDLVFHAGNLLDPATLARELDPGDSRLLTDDFAPVDTLVLAAGE
jgi:predicted membrane-bound spermidine synthase